MVNILVAVMIESHGRIPPISVWTNYARGIATRFHIAKTRTQKMIVCTCMSKNIAMILRPILSILLEESRLFNPIPMMVYVCVKGQISRTA
ncbi:hypothetical protein ATANTOWER_029585 [Ataeniobius toweri]|uniref:Uncharacterized protein n=1 Tax=Ataeniobius toweri TaxID=208326 RepID=A0ABU7BV14_9TELE|nr:hypothetical protein [Ataeniobius toweri]